MKLRTVLISVVVTAALVGGAGYGAYYAAQGQKSPVEVVPVSNVSMGSWMDDPQIIYGSVTSQVAQTVQLDDNYTIDKIYVDVGDKVKEGTPLFSYDMTMQELELEMQQLELQTNELTMTRLEKELDKLKKTPASASLERNWFTLTASAEEAPAGEEPEEKTLSGGEPEEKLPEAGAPAEKDPDEGDFAEKASNEEEANEDQGEAEILPEEGDTEDTGKHDGAVPEPAQPGVEVDKVEKVGGSGTEEDSGLSAIADSVLSYEGLVLELQATFLTCGDDLKADDVGEAIERAVVYYRKNLAEEKLTEEAQEDGSVREIRSYVISKAVKKVLSKEELATLRERCKTLNAYQTKYVEMLIDEAEDLEGDELAAAVRKISESYDLLATAQQDMLKNYEEFEELRASAGLDGENSEPSEENAQSQEDDAQGGDGAGQGQEDGAQGCDGAEQGQEGGAQGSDGAEQGQEGGAQGSEDAGPSQEGDSENGGSGEIPGADAGQDVRYNTVAFDVAEGAHAAVAGEDVTNSIAMAQDGRIIFVLSLENGYELTEVLVDGSIPARKNDATEDPDDYIVEGIQTNDTIVSVHARKLAGEDVEEPGQSDDTLSGDGSDTEPIDSERAAGSETADTDGTEDGDGNTGGTADGNGLNTDGAAGGDGANTDETAGGDGANTDGTAGGDGTDADKAESGEGADTGETSDGDASDTEKESSKEDETEPESSSEETPDTNPAQTKKYTVTIKPGSRTETYEAGRLVPLQADMGDVTLLFNGWSVAPTSGDPNQTVELDGEDVEKGYASFRMPEFDVTATARYQNAPDAIESYSGTFLESAGKLLAENAAQNYAAQGKDFLTEAETAIVFYQQWLSDPATAVLDDEVEDDGPKMQDYKLLANVSSYLKEQGKEVQVTQLTKSYKELCLLYAKTLFARLDPAALDPVLLQKAADTYALLGPKWQKELEKRWKQEQAELAEQAGQPWEKNKKGKSIAPADFMGIGDTLAAYHVMQMFQEYLTLPPDTPEEERYSLLLDVWSAYQELGDVQKAYVSSDPLFVETLRQNGLWEDEEPETEFPDYWGGDDFGGDWDEPLYTAEELQAMIRDKEQEIKACELDIKQSELDVKQKQRIVDGKVVKSTMEGTVISVGGMDGQSDEDYFLKVANEAGLYVKGSMNELTLERLNVGDTISGMLTMNGTEFTAVIKEVSEYPDASGAYMSYGQENTNASYYPFYALIDDTEDLEEGEAEIYLTATAPSRGTSNAIYLENFFIRSEPDGRTYVYKKGDDGNLTKQYVKTGKNTGYSMEISEGLELSDMIAFPYGKNVKEGAKTKEVDRLQDAYM